MSESTKLALSDGTYERGMFVCDECYIKLDGMGLGVGEPWVVQGQAFYHIREGNPR